MQNLLRSFSLILLISALAVGFEQILAQCPGAKICDDAYVFCSLNELNGFSCTNTGPFQTVCSPHCDVPGTMSTRNWWAFVSDGGDVTITLSVGACNPPNKIGELSWGIWGDCNCMEKIACDGLWGTGEVATFQVNLEPCKKYYLTIDGALFNGANIDCDFTINTSGGGITINDINNISSGIIEPVCAGICNYKFFINPPSTCQTISCDWTLDGKSIGVNNNEVHLGFPDEGDFVLCVTAYSDIKTKSSKCHVKLGQKCSTVQVRRLPDITGEPRTVCYGEKWHSQFIYKSGKYHEQFNDINCCKYDSIIEFTVLPEPETVDVYYFSCDNKPFIDKLGRSYQLCQDHKYISLPKTTDPYRCDSSIRLTSVGVYDSLNWQTRCLGGKVEISPNFSILKQCNIGETYNFDYKWYKKNDTLRKSISTNERLVVDTVNEDYCLDVNIKINLGNDSAFCTRTYCDTINEANVKNTLETIKLYYCDSAIINGKTYTQTTQFKQQLKNIFGCDSINITDLNITKSSTTDIVQNACDSIFVNNQLYTSTGAYKQILTNANNCDSVLNLQLNIGKSNNSNFTWASCDSAIINGQAYLQSGNFNQSLINLSGCDSVIHLDLHIAKTSRDSLYLSSCDSVTYNGQIYKQSGDYVFKYQSAGMCDSIIVVHVNIPNSNNSPYVLTKCDSVSINGTYYDQSGNFFQKLKSTNGCDSTLNIDLTIAKSNSSIFKLTSCDSALINGKWYFQSGNYTQLLQNANQCDSTLNIDLNITKSSRGDTLFRSCDSVRINGQIYKQTGIYQQTLTNSNLCDSLLVIDFIRLSKTSTALSFRSCDSVVVNNQVFTQSGVYTQVFTNANQCDSILNLNVTITKSNSAISNLSACDSLSVNGQTYYQSGNYIQNLTNADLCDSTLNISLNIYKSSSINYAFKSCDSVNINGQIYTQSGNYKQYLKDVHLCDSTINILLTLSKSEMATLSKNVCDSLDVNGIRYYISGQYKQNLMTSDGCDSTLTLDLIIKPGNPSTLDAGADTSICEGEIIKLNGIFQGLAKFNWHSVNGNFDSPNALNTNYYSNTIGDERIYLQAADDCKQWLDSLAVHVLPRQIVLVTGDTILNPCKEISFTASGGTNYIWTPSSYIECLDPPCSRVILKSSAVTRFTISTDGPCAVPANLNLSLAQIQNEVWLPNTFSPNGDNINDVFLPIFNCEQVDYYNLQIFDRWGNLIFESQNKEKGWDGKYQNQNMNPGVYPYVMQYEIRHTARKIKVGEVTLIR